MENILNLLDKYQSLRLIGLGKEYDDVEKIKDPKLREKARKMIRLTKNTKNFVDLK